MRILTTILTLYLVLSVAGQDKVDGRTDYPDSLELNKEYSFDISNDSITQTITIKALGDQKLWFSIDTRTKDNQMHGGQRHDFYSGTAKCNGAYGVITQDGTMYLDQWDYKTTDNILTITIYDKTASRVTLTTADLVKDFMKRKK